MITLSTISVNSIRRQAIACASVCMLAAPIASFAQGYAQTNLASDVPGLAVTTDPNSKNAWGLARSPRGSWLVTNAGTGTVSIYDGNGSQAPYEITVPSSRAGSPGSPTGNVYHPGSGFDVVPGRPARYVFVSFDGTISAYNRDVNPTNAILKVTGSTTSRLTGAALAYVGNKQRLYVADLLGRKISAYDANFQPVALAPTAFVDPTIPAGYSPFNVQNLGGFLVVTFAQPSATAVNFGAGLGYVGVFTPSGRLLGRLQSGPWFNAPWAVAFAPSDFGKFSHRLLIGQFGSGQILAFNPFSGAYEGVLADGTGNAIVIPFLWGLAFGDGFGSGPANALYFAAGINATKDGLFGNLTPVGDADAASF